jgi:hypothetical protein
MPIWGSKAAHDGRTEGEGWQQLRCGEGFIGGGLSLI